MGTHEALTTWKGHTAGVLAIAHIGGKSVEVSSVEYS